MKNPLEIENLVVESGEKGCGPLNVARRADGSDIFVPLMVVNGREDGPVLNISAGCHGDEYEGMEAVRRAYKNCDPASLKGAIIGVPVVNTVAFEAGQRVSPFDLANLNRQFPGIEKGFFTQRLAYIYFEHVVRQADYVIDLHNGGNIMTLAPMAIYRDIGGPDVAERAEKLVRATGIKMIWKGSGGWTGPISLEAQNIGIPAITVEVAGEGRYRERVVAQFEKMIANILATFQMTAGTPELPDRVVQFEGTFINSIHGGFYRQLVELEENVKQGDRVAIISDVFGETVEEIKSPFDGIVCSKRTTGFIEPGGWTLMVGTLV